MINVQRKSRKNAEHRRSERRLEVRVSLKRQCSGVGGAGAWAAQGHRDYTVARIKIRTKSGRKVIFSERVDGKAVVCYIKKGDSAGLRV